ncbi:MAG: GIY-YIG nuclease family protein, partial [Bacteroidetes bacterium]|nr:GIY-YIG nuclease family protein [Bacteroidota bacterium]
ICFHNGEKVLSTWQTLVNPEVNIPAFITALTGITNEMVQDAPLFSEVADELYDLLHSHIFVAHNVGFDYGFIKNHLADNDILYNSKRLCTVRLSRKVFPGLKSYSLGQLTSQLKIPIKDRHRAMGDCEATAKLFTLINQHDKDGHLEAMLNRNSKETRIPSNVNKQEIEALPEKQGIYYFKNQMGVVIYVGKSANIKKRVLEHFTLNSTTQRRTRFAEEIFSISYATYSDDMITALMECHEIKRLWPKYNSEFKKRSNAYGVYSYADQNGVARLYVNKLLHKSKPLMVYSDYTSAFNYVKNKVLEFNLCPKHSAIQEQDATCINTNCNGYCLANSDVNYKSRSTSAINSILNEKPSFALVGDSENGKEPIVVVHEGHYLGWGYFDEELEPEKIQDIIPALNRFKENMDIHRIVNHYVATEKKKLIVFSSVELEN